jgi:amino acid adenylation domain-containing protein
VTRALAGELVTASLAQQGIWVTERAGVAGTAYHMPLTIRFAGRLDVPALRDACTALVVRHPALGSAVYDDAGVARLVRAPNPPEVAVLDVPAEAVAGTVADEIRRPFDLNLGPLARFTLLSSAPDRHVLLVVVHHLVFDGESKDILVRDLATLYRSRLADPEPRPAGDPDPARAEQDRVAAVMAEAGEFWRAQWREPADAVLPGLRRTPRAAEPGDVVDAAVNGPLWTGLLRTASEAGVTVFELVLSAVGVLLHRYGAESPVVAVDVSTRTLETRDRVGLFVNELPLGFPALGPSTVDFARAVRARLRERYRYREVPVAHAVGGLSPRPSLAPVSVSYRRRGPAPEFPGVDATVDWAVFGGSARNALHVHAVQDPDGLLLRLLYSPAVIGRPAVVRIAGHLVTLLRGLVASPSAAPADLPLLSTVERATLLTGWNATTRAYPPGATLVTAFRAQAEATPDAVAVAGGGRRLSYAALHRRSDAWARWLRAVGVGPGSRVGVRLPRSPDLVVALLAVAKAGAAYVPLDPTYPQERLEYIASDAGLALVLDSVPLLVESAVCDPPGDGPGPDDLAYTIYTSGSTGRPKGVDVPHRALLNLLYAMRDALGSTPGDTWLGLTSLSFDISALELFLPLVTGGRVVLADDRSTVDGVALDRLVRAEGVTHVQATPAGWRMLLDAGFDHPGVVAVAGGEALPAPLACDLRAGVGRLVNAYGPTETTIWSTLADVGEMVRIGRPVANTTVYVLDDRLRPVPIGVPGELCIGGTGVARGYHGQPDRTAERFRPDPFGPPGSRLYRTGDLVRYADDGELEFLGRLDNQVKLRGYRIEPGEIEARLLAHPRVAQAAVVVRAGEAGPWLVAYVVADGRPPDVGELREHLARTLPAYMLPGTVVVLERMPLTPNGKLDRASLPEPPRAAAPPAAEVSATGAAVTEIWCDVLGLPGIGPEENLFDLGGHSLVIMQIMARIRQRLGVEVPMDAFFVTPTVAGIAAAIDAEAGR